MSDMATPAGQETGHQIAPVVPTLGLDAYCPFDNDDQFFRSHQKGKVMSEKKPQYFVREANSGEPLGHMGDDPVNVADRVKEFAQAEIEEMARGNDGGRCVIEIVRRDMTDEEVAAIPEM